MKVVALIKGLNTHLPIGAPLAANMSHHPHFVDLVMLKVTLGQSNGSFQGYGVVGHADENQTSMLLTSHRGQSRSMADHGVLKGLFVGDGAKRPVVTETPAVERAYEYFFIASLFSEQPGTAMRTNVVERFHT